MKGLNTFKRIVSIVLVSFMFTLNVFAEETYNASYRIEIDEEQNVSVEETTLDGEIDNSDLEVKVVKYNGESETVIYTGPLGEYDNGAWSSTDFSDIQFLVVFEWDGAENDAIYIIPISDESVELDSETITEASESEISLLSVEADADDTKYSIKQAIIKNSNDVIVHDCPSNGQLESVTLVKHTNDAVPARVFAALYDNGKLENMKTVEISGTESENTEIMCDINLLFGTITESHYVKIMVWEGYSTLKPLVDAYDTSIVTTDYVYSNTIQVSGQEDEYSFTVPNDGYYSIFVPSGNNINGTLYHSSDLQNAIATKNSMSSSNKLTYYLQKNEIYTIKFSSQDVGVYSFSIVEDSVSNVLSLNSSTQGMLAYNRDRLVYEFNPAETAIYFFEVSGDIHPYAILYDENDNMLEFAENLDYQETIVLRFELTANQTYYLKVGSQSRLVGNISTYVKKVKVSTDGTAVNITGNLDSISGTRVALSIYDANGSLKRISQVNTASNGSFSYSTILDTSNQAYQCVINQNSQTMPVYFEFGTGTISKTIETYEKASITGAATVTPTFNSNRITANSNMTVDISIKNNDSNNQDILSYWVLSDSSGNIVEACGTGSEFTSNQTEILHMEMLMPTSVAGLTLKLFTWQGKNIDQSTFRPLAKVYTISTSGTSSLSIEDEELPTNEINADSEVELVTEENVDETIDYSAVKATSGLLNTSTPMAISELDLIDMNFMVRCNGKNTGGELQLGKNIITIYYKNKTDVSQTFDPLVLWGYYDENGDLQQTYFHWHESITLAPKGDSNYGDVQTIDYEVEVPANVDFAAGYWAINENYDYVCTNPTAIRYNGIYQGQPAPLFFEEVGGGKFIYCNNREGIKRTDLADSNNPNPRLLMHEKGLFDGTYEMLLFHNNDTSIGIDPDTGETISYGSGFPIYLDVQFYDPYGTAQIQVTSVGYQIPMGESWACIQGYSDYKQMTIQSLTGLEETVYPLSSSELSLPYTHSFSQSPTMWIGDKMPSGYYKPIPMSRCVYMVIEFNIYNSQGIEVNVAAFKDNENGFENRFSDYQAGSDPNITAPFIKDMQYKGIANTLPQVDTKLIMAIDDNVTSGSNLPVTVFNPLEPGGNTAYWWKTNINPQSERYYANLSDASNMLHFTYNDPQKLNAYGADFSGSKDTIWRFDVEHSDTYQFPANRSADSDPNYVLPRPYIVNDNGESSNLYVGQNLANYGVVNRYNYEVYNFSSNQKSGTFNLETGSNNVIVLRHPDSPNEIYLAYFKGENTSQVKDVLNEFTLESGTGVGTIIDVILTTGNAGGMANSVTVTE